MAASILAYDSLKITPFEMKLHEVKLTKKVNDHARLSFTGIISEDFEDKYIQMANENTPVTLHYTDHEGESKILFHGMILKLHIRVDREVYWLEVEAISHTYEMDVKLENRAFQDKSLLIEDVMKDLSAHYPKTQINNTYPEKHKIGAFTLQYHETDWQFLKRMASHYHAPLVPVASRENISFYLGIPDHKDIGEIKATHYRVYKDLLAFKKTGDTKSSGLTEKDFMCYEVVLDQVLELGDRVTFKGQKLHVFEVEIEMIRGILTSRYTLCLKKAGYQRQIYNNHIIGASIQGKVMAVVRDEVKVKLDYDQGWNMDTAYLFPYSTMYASEDQTGWYCMPEKGDDVRIYFPSAKEAEGIALSTVRKKLPAEPTGGGGTAGTKSGKNSSGSGNVTTTAVQPEMQQPSVSEKEDMMANPNNKFLLTPTGQKILFEEDKITIIGAANGALITLTNSGTILLNSNNKISLQTGKQIEMVGESIMMVANQIDMSTEGGFGGIKIDQGQVVVRGVEVLMEK